jgi:hypothetical protein
MEIDYKVLANRFTFGLVVLLISAVGFVYGFQQFNKRINERYALADSWSSDTVDVHATGLANTTLSITMLDDDSANDHIRCDLLVGEILSDKKLSKQLRDAGFETVQCGTLSVGIK